MNELIELLRDGKSRTPEMLADELHTSVEVVMRNIEFLERAGIIKRITFSDCQSSGHSYDGCSGCGTGKKTCKGCMPEGGFQHMGVMWEVIK